MFLRSVAIIFAIIFFCLGILGFIPATISPNRTLLHVVTVGPFINLFYIFTSLIAFSTSGTAVLARLFFRFFGVIYACIAIWGFAENGNLRIVHVAISDSFFHLIMAVIALYLGFTSKLPLPPRKARKL